MADLYTAYCYGKDSGDQVNYLTRMLGWTPTTIKSGDCTHFVNTENSGHLTLVEGDKIWVTKWNRIDAFQNSAGLFVVTET